MIAALDGVGRLLVLVPLLLILVAGLFAVLMAWMGDRL